MRPLHPTRCLHTLRPLHTAARRAIPRPPPRIGSVPNTDDFSDTQIRNPLDSINNSTRWAAERAWRIRRMKLAGAGVVLCVLMQLGIMYMIKLDDPETIAAGRMEGADEGATLQEKGGEQGREGGEGVSHMVQGLLPRDRCDELPRPPAQVPDPNAVPTGTSSVPTFPRTISLPGARGGTEEYTLLGLGIRTVSFLGVQVYVIGHYIPTSSFRVLRKVVSAAAGVDTRKGVREAMLDPEMSSQIWNAIIDSGVPLALRVVPTRGTDWGHLRDGWVRGIVARAKDLAAAGDEVFADEGFGAAIGDFKKMLGGKGSMPKGGVIYLVREARGGLRVWKGEGGEEEVGYVSDQRISRAMWLMYFGGKNVSSEGARKAVAEGVGEVVAGKR
ncbi:chalcone isomerase [Trichodelitschia bisporula]|uniref:Chalcone isomerase n=1 Tax=Trichodelitschia bisporula TaxID=703511 RepID=A0A6G1I5I7_9PEZI|nr:chalcone isomerase [Trichodelitschia bisporula]